MASGIGCCWLCLVMARYAGYYAGLGPVVLAIAGYAWLPVVMLLMLPGYGLL